MIPSLLMVTFKESFLLSRFVPSSSSQLFELYDLSVYSLFVHFQVALDLTEEEEQLVQNITDEEIRY